LSRTLFLFKSFRAKMMFFFILAMVLLAGISDFLIHRYALRSQFEQLRNRLMIIAQIAAVNVDVEKLAEIPLEKEGFASKQYRVITEELARIKDVSPTIKYMYILAPTAKPGILKFVVDVQTSKASDLATLSYPGDEYDARRFPEMLRGFSGTAADRKLTTDEWGVFLSGYAPIRDKAGRVMAILGVDMGAQDVYDVQKEVNRRAVFVLFLSMALAVMLGIILSTGVSRQIAELAKGAQRVAKGDLDYKVLVKGADEIARLAQFFNQMSVDLKLHVEELKRTTAEKERLIREIEIARDIQQSFLPDHAPLIEGIDIAAVTVPARIVGGDFYDYIPLEKNKWGLVIADVSGKGVPAALFMALSRTLMRASATVAVSAAEALNHVNTLIIQDSKASMFVTLFYAIFDADTRSLKYSNAGHNPPLFISAAAGDIATLKAHSAPLGIMPDIKAKTEELILKKGDSIMLYTDGVTEAANEKGEQFEIGRLERAFSENRNLSAEQIINRVEQEISLFAGGQPQYDDITIMIIKAI